MLDYIRVDAHVVVGVADSNDPGDDPDTIPAVGTVVFTPTRRQPTTLVPAQTILVLAQVTCEIDAEGNLRPPLDGQNTPVDADGNLFLISPQSPDLLDQGWTWGVEFRPAQGQRWQGFNLSGVTGAPGETVVLTTAQFPVTSPTTQALLYRAASTAEPYPTGFRPGIDYLVVPNGDGTESIWGIV